MNGDAYILGPGDAVMVELLDVPEYSVPFQLVQTAPSIYQDCVRLQ